MSFNATLTLKHVNPVLNRHRKYRIFLEELDNGSRLLVCSWGRIGQKMKSKTDIFNSDSELLKRLQAILNRRFRHDYKITQKSAHFPAVPALQRFEWWWEPQQLRLFED